MRLSLTFASALARRRRAHAAPPPRPGAARPPGGAAGPERFLLDLIPAAVRARRSAAAGLVLVARAGGSPARPGRGQLGLAGVLGGVLPVTFGRLGLLLRPIQGCLCLGPGACGLLGLAPARRPARAVRAGRDGRRLADVPAPEYLAETATASLTTRCPPPVRRPGQRFPIAPRRTASAIALIGERRLQGVLYLAFDLGADSLGPSPPPAPLYSWVSAGDRQAAAAGQSGNRFPIQGLLRLARRPAELGKISSVPRPVLAGEQVHPAARSQSAAEASSIGPGRYRSRTRGAPGRPADRGRL